MAESDSRQEVVVHPSTRRPQKIVSQRAETVRKKSIHNGKISLFNVHSCRKPFSETLKELQNVSPQIIALKVFVKKSSRSTKTKWCIPLVPCTGYIGMNGLTLYYRKSEWKIIYWVHWNHFDILMHYTTGTILCRESRRRKFIINLP